MAIIAQVRAFEHINFNKNCGVDEFFEDFLAPDAAMHPETESGRFACAKRPYLAGAEGLEFDMTQKPKKTEANKAPEIKGFSQYGQIGINSKQSELWSKLWSDFTMVFPVWLNVAAARRTQRTICLYYTYC